MFQLPQACGLEGSRGQASRHLTPGDGGEGPAFLGRFSAASRFFSLLTGRWKGGFVLYCWVVCSGAEGLDADAVWECLMAWWTVRAGEGKAW